MVSVIIVEREPLGPRSVLRQLRGDPRLSVLHVLDDGRTAITLARAVRPDVVIAERDLPGAGGLAIATALAASHPRIRVVLHASGVAPAAPLASVVDPDAPRWVLRDALARLGATHRSTA